MLSRSRCNHTRSWLRYSYNCNWQRSYKRVESSGGIMGLGTLRSFLTGKPRQQFNMVPPAYGPDYPMEHQYQAMNTWVYPSVPAHEQRSALINCWTGNQLPGECNYIPGVQSALWNHPTSYANTLVNQQYNQGYNIQTGSVLQNAQLQVSIMQAWLNRSGYTSGG